MLTLRQFIAMSESYGADLRRWPRDLRRDAEGLLDICAAARAALSDAKELDTAIAAGGQREDSMLFPSAERAAALTRLRSAVAARAVVARPQRGVGARLRSMLTIEARSPSTPLRWIGMAACSGFAVLAGILVGATYVAPAPQNTVLMMLQAAPIHILAD